MVATERKREPSLRHRVAISTALFFGGLGGFLLAGYVVIALLAL
jgi:hypothetical protein